MNVKRIVVDKKDGCVACPFCVRVNDYMKDHYECRATGRKIFDCTGMKYREYIEKFEEIGTPNWCPLEVEEECVWVGKQKHKGKHDECIEYKSPHIPIHYHTDFSNFKETKKYIYCHVCGRRIKYVESEE